MAKNFEVFEGNTGITCGPAQEMKAKFWVSQPAPPFAWGKFLCACETREDAEMIADAMQLLFESAAFIKSCFGE